MSQWHRHNSIIVSTVCSSLYPTETPQTTLAYNAKLIFVTPSRLHNSFHSFISLPPEPLRPMPTGSHVDQTINQFPIFFDILCFSLLSSFPSFVFYSPKLFSRTLREIWRRSKIVTGSLASSYFSPSVRLSSSLPISLRITRR